jgi:hypothetical protein
MPHFNLQEEVLAISNPADLSLYSITNELDLESLSAREVDDALESELWTVGEESPLTIFRDHRSCRSCGTELGGNRHAGSPRCIPQSTKVSGRAEGEAGNVVSPIPFPQAVRQTQ